MIKTDSDSGFVPIPRSRTIVLDVVRWARRVPSFPVEQVWEAQTLSALRTEFNSQSPASNHADPRFSAHRISWAALFLRAYGLACRDFPPLRQTFHRFPWGRVFQSDHVGIAICVNRNIEGQDRLYFGRLEAVDSLSIREIQDRLNYYQYHDPQTAFRQQHLAAGLPRPLRDLMWWWRIEVNCRRTAQRVGTASLSTLAGQGFYNRNHPCLMTSSLSYSPLDSRGRTTVTLQCDHRVMDGFQAGQALTCLRHHFLDTVLGELQSQLGVLGKGRAAA